MGPCVFSLPISLVIIGIILVRYLIIIIIIIIITINMEVSTMCYCLGLGHESLRFMFFYVVFEDSMRLSDYNICYVKHIQDSGNIYAREGEVNMKYVLHSTTVEILIPLAVAVCIQCHAVHITFCNIYNSVCDSQFGARVVATRVYFSLDYTNIWFLLTTSNWIYCT